MITVRAGTPPSVCSGHKMPGGSCRARVYWVHDRHGNIPVDCDVEGGTRPSESSDPDQGDIFTGAADVHDGQGENHAPLCPDRALFAMRARERAGE